MCASVCPHEISRLSMDGLLLYLKFCNFSKICTEISSYIKITQDTQRQARELISVPCLGAKAKFLSFNRTQSSAVTGLLTGHNNLKRHLHLLGLSDSQLCRRCGAEDEKSAHIECECAALASLRQVYLGSFLEPEDINSTSLGAIWNFSKATGLP
jgi:hypothetical protein